MKKIAQILIVFLLLSIFLPVFPVQAAGSAIMRLNSVKTDYYVGDTIYVDIMVEPNGVSLNVARAVMNFSGSDTLLVNDFNIGSAFPYLSPGKELNNDTNHINVGGFILAETVAANSKFGTLIFKANQIGSSIINFAAGSHLISSDQQEALNLAGSQGITINVSAVPPLPPPTPLPLPPSITANLAPVFHLIGNKAINIDDTIGFSVQATDPEGDLIAFSWNIPPGAIFNNVVNKASTVSGDFSWTPTSQGAFNAVFTAVDSKGNTANLSVSINVSPTPLIVHPPAFQSVLTVSVGVAVPQALVNHQPVFEPVAEKTVNAGKTIAFNISATDPDGDDVSLTLEPLETAALSPITDGATATSRLSWTPENAGIYYAVFKAADNNSNSLSSFLTVRITVFGGACPPCSGGGSGTCPICQCEKITAQESAASSISHTAPIITSPSHPGQDIWYSNNNPQFIWQTFDQPENFIFNLDQNPLTNLDYGYLSSQEKMFSFNGISDGFWYFHLRSKYSDGFSPTAHYQVKIDTKAPEYFKPSLQEEKVNGQIQYKIYFSAIDKYSGIDFFEMQIDKQEWQKIASPYILNDEEKQSAILTLRAVDKAGNVIENYIDLSNFVALDKPAKTYTIEKIKVIEPPIIDKVEFKEITGNLRKIKALVVSGQASANSDIIIYLSSQPEATFTAKADNNGFWQADYSNDLVPGKYSIYATASLNGATSAFSDKVFFSLLEKFSAEKKIYLPWYIYAIFVLLAGLSFVLWLYQKILQKNFDLLKRLYGKTKNGDKVRH